MSQRASRCQIHCHRFIHQNILKLVKEYIDVQEISFPTDDRLSFISDRYFRLWFGLKFLINKNYIVERISKFLASHLTSLWNELQILID